LIDLGVEKQLAEAVQEKEQVEGEKERLTILLEEERKKVEDLQFRFHNFFFLKWDRVSCWGALHFLNNFKHNCSAQGGRTGV
jgi:hypothetical protein